MQLTHKLVQPFIATLEEALSYKVTITDSQGIIIGTSDLTRLNEFHPSAYEILCGREPLERLENGVYINIPDTVVLGYGEKIVYGGECLGIIGIVGPPEERKASMKIAQMILYLLLDRLTAQQEVDFVIADRNSFIASLLQGMREREPWQKKRAERYGINIDLPRYVIVIHAASHSGRDPSLFGLTKRKDILLQRIAEVSTSTDELVYVAESGEIVVLSAAGNHKNAARRARSIDKQVNDLYESIEELFDTPVYIGVSQDHEDYLTYSVGYQEALTALEIGIKTKRDGYIFRYSQMRLGRIIGKFDPETREILNHSVIERLSREDKDHLFDTLRVYFEENLNVSKTASRLFIHRNTLQYRFHQIRELTGYDIRNIDDLIQLRLAVLQHQLFQKPVQEA